MIRTSGKRRGFTLVELLVVVAMIALITAAMSTSVSSGHTRARIQRATAEVKAISQAILSYENFAKGQKIKTMEDTPASRTSLSFMLSGTENSAANTKIPVLMQAALAADGTFRDPWGEPYRVTIREGSSVNVAEKNLKTGYMLPNFYRLSAEERQ